jgi:hypothetical protein
MRQPTLASLSKPPSFYSEVPRGLPGSGSLAKPSDTGSGTLPSDSSCGSLPNSPVLTTGLNLNTPNEVQWPTYWPSGPTQTGIQNLNCSNPPSTPSPAIYFVTTQRRALAASNCGQVYNPPNVNPCTSIVHQSSQYVPTQAPPLPVTIVGTGFGFLPQHVDTIGSNNYTEMGLPFVPPPGSGLSSSSFLRITDCPASSTCPTPTLYNWDTAANPQCQVYIANWSDSSISVDVNAPVNATDYYPQPSGTLVSPLADFSLLTLFPTSQNSIISFH